MNRTERTPCQSIDNTSISPTWPSPTIARTYGFRTLEPKPACAGFTTLPLQDYFGFFSRWRFQAHAGAATVFVDEFDAGVF